MTPGELGPDSPFWQCVTLVAIVVVGVALIHVLDRWVWKKDR